MDRCDSMQFRGFRCGPSNHGSQSRVGPLIGVQRKKPLDRCWSCGAFDSLRGVNESKDMIDFYDPCKRRSFLQVGSLGLGGMLGGMSLPRILEAGSDAESSRILRDRSVVFLFMHGGPPQAETFDPKMTAASEYRCFNGEIKTSVPGLTYGASLEKLARLADKTTVVRSFQPGDGNHNIKPLVSPHSLGANVGSLYSRISGITDKTTGMPSNAVLLPRAVDEEAQTVTKQFGDFSDTGKMGSAYAPFVPSGKGALMDNMKLKLSSKARLDDRRALLRNPRWIQASILMQPERWMELTSSTARLTTSSSVGVTQAFDLSRMKTRQLVARYDTSQVGAAGKDRSKIGTTTKTIVTTGKHSAS